ncbi:MAG: hypothetical protein ACJ8CR_10675 [Roseiflexaceae bacterium]
MLDQDRIDQQLQLLTTHRRTLAHYLKQQAMLGETYSPPAVTHGIEGARKSIHQIKAILRSHGSSFIQKPWKAVWNIEEKPELFAFKSQNGFDGICRIERINLPNEKVVVICEEVDENPGNSVTNSVEYIAIQVCEQYRIDPQNLIWIEHYDTWYDKYDEWKLVMFNKKPPEDNFADPKWKIMTETDWRFLGFRPKKGRTERRKEPDSRVKWLGQRK